MITENMEEWEDTWQDMAVYKLHSPDQGRGGMRWGGGRRVQQGTPLDVQWLRFHAANAEGLHWLRN